MNAPDRQRTPVRSTSRDHSASRHVRFADYRFDLETLELFHMGVTTPLAPKPARVLAALLERPGRLVTREDLYSAGWGETVVSVDLALNTAMRHLRRALGDQADAPRFIETVPRRGYRFVAEVVPVAREVTSPRRRWVGALGLAAALAIVAAWMALTPEPRTVAVGTIASLDATFPQGATTVLEHRIRSSVVRRADRHVTVLASGAEAEFVVQGSLYAPSAGEWLLDLQVVRSADNAIVWSGAFNPFCPRVADPGAFIADYMANVVGRVT